MRGGPALSARGVRLRAARDGDVAFLRALFETARPDAAFLAAWPEEARRAFLDQQFGFQSLHYARAYPDAERLVVLKDGAPIGRIILQRAPAHWCLDVHCELCCDPPQSPSIAVCDPGAWPCTTHCVVEVIGAYGMTEVNIPLYGEYGRPQRGNMRASLCTLF